MHADHTPVLFWHPYLDLVHSPGLRMLWGEGKLCGILLDTAEARIDCVSSSSVPALSVPQPCRLHSVAQRGFCCQGSESENLVAAERFFLCSGSPSGICWERAQALCSGQFSVEGCGERARIFLLSFLLAPGPQPPAFPLRGKTQALGVKVRRIRLGVTHVPHLSYVPFPRAQSAYHPVGWMI